MCVFGLLQSSPVMCVSLLLGCGEVPITGSKREKMKEVIKILPHQNKREIHVEAECATLFLLSSLHHRPHSQDIQKLMASLAGLQ